MLRMTRWVMAHRRVVAVGWVAITIALLVASSAVGTRKASNFSLPGTGSQQAADLLKSRFPAQAGDTDQIVFRARSGTLRTPATERSVDAVVARVAKLPHVTAIVSPYAPGARGLSRD